MRHLLKKISLILVLCISISSFAFAAETSVTQTENAGYRKLYSVLLSLDIIKADDLFATEFSRDITEDEFNKLLSNLTEADYTATSDGNFVFNSAVQKLLDLMGYDVKVRTIGPYPTGYISVADELGLFEGMKVKGDKPFTVGDALVLIFNALDKPLLVLKIHGGDVRYEMMENTSLLSRYKDIYFNKGIVSDNSITNYKGRSELGKNRIIIDGIMYETDQSSYADMIGRYVGVYYKLDNDGEGKILYLEDITPKSDIFRVNAKDIISCKDLIFKYYRNDRQVQLEISPSTTVIYNNIALMYEDSLFTPECGYVEFIDNNSDGNVDVAVIKSYYNMVVRQVGDFDMELRDANDKMKTITFKERDGDYIIKNINGESVGFDYFKAYDVVSIAESKNGEFVEVIVSNRFATGDVTVLSLSGDEKAVTISGKEYIIDSSYINVARDLKLGMYGTALLDFEGEVVFFADESTNTRYGYIISGALNDDADSEEMLLKMLTQDDEIATYSCLEKIKINGNTVKGTENIKNALTESGTIKQQLIKYRLNGENKICFIDTAMDVTQTESQYTSDETIYEDHLRLYKKSANGIYLSGGQSIEAGLIVPSNAKIFVVGADGSREERLFRVLPVSYLYSGKNQATYDVYTTNKECLEAEVLLTRTNISLPMLYSMYGQAHLIQKISLGLDEDDDATYLIHAINNGKSVEYLADKTYISNVDLKVGDVARLWIGDNGMIQKIAIVHRMGNGFTNVGAFNSEFFAVTGYVYNYGSGVIQITQNSKQNLKDYIIPSDSKFFKDTGLIYIWDSSGRKFYAATKADIRSFKHDSSADTITTISNAGKPILHVIYR